jgi:uncharacterized membrane protein YkgB
LVPLAEHLTFLISYSLPIIELCLGIFLIAGWLPKLTSTTTIVVLTIFSAIAIVAIAVGTTASCGCFGALFEERTDIFLVLRNVFLLTLAIFHSSHLQKTLQYEEKGD